MLQQVILGIDSPTTLNIDAVDPDDIIVVKSISGLDPADVTLFMGDFARDGGYYQGRRSGQRNVVFNLKLNPDYANDIEVSDIREMLYDMFFEANESTAAPDHAPEAVVMTFVDDRRPDRYLVGYTEKFPADIFSRETGAQISLLCPEPFLRSVLEVNEIDAVGWVQQSVTYDGSAKTGLVMTFKVGSASPTMFVDVNGAFMALDGPFAANDEIGIDTRQGSRRVLVNGFDRMAALRPGSSWITLRKGVNVIKAYGETEGDGKVAMTQYTYRAAWWGI